MSNSDTAAPNADLASEGETVLRGKLPHFEPAESPTGGWGDWCGCAWPDPKHTRSFGFCENGAKTVAFELTKRRVSPDFFAAHTVSELALHSEYWLEE